MFYEIEVETQSGSWDYRGNFSSLESALRYIRQVLNQDKCRVLKYRSCYMERDVVWESKVVESKVAHNWMKEGF